MQPNPIISEPPPNLDDTSPNAATISTIAVPPPNRLAGCARTALILAAALITVSAAVLYIQQGNTPAPTVPAPTIIVVTPLASATVPPAPTLAPTSAPSVMPSTSAPTAAPVAADQAPAPDVLAELMAQPADSAPPQNVMFHSQTAFTIAPAGPRVGVIQYQIQSGDTVELIAKRFNLANDTIGWNNPIQYLNLLQVGSTLTILPIDGILYTPTAEQTIQQIADKFKVSPYAIINSEYNHLQNATPSFVVPANALQIMVPGGVTDKVLTYWKPAITTRGGSPSGGGGYGTNTNQTGQIEFGGGPGSCGFQNNGGGDGSLVRPLNGYVVVRSFSSYHSGIDLSRSIGTPVDAAGTGTVIFAGWSDWGYGNSIVIAHTPNLMTLYGHLSQIGVRCGQTVTKGQQIGNVGSTGNSTGPHLHFEIRIGQVPVDPTSMMAF